jgi:hypothetical protein
MIQLVALPESAGILCNYVTIFGGTDSNARFVCGRVEVHEQRQVSSSFKY